MVEDVARQDEETLIERAVAGDAEAFGELYVRHLDDIYRYVFYKVSSEKRAEDLTEQIFLKAWEAMDGYHFRGYPFSSWLYRIAHNTVVDHYRMQKDEDPLDPAAFTLADDSLGPEEALIKKRQVAELLSALRHLSEEKQELIILRFVEGFSHARVAQILDKSEGACRVMQHRALKELNDILNDILGREA